MLFGPSILEIPTANPEMMSGLSYLLEEATRPDGETKLDR
jgi:hypothetical protein